MPSSRSHPAAATWPTRLESGAPCSGLSRPVGADARPPQGRRRPDRVVWPRVRVRVRVRRRRQARCGADAADGGAGDLRAGRDGGAGAVLRGVGLRIRPSVAAVSRGRVFDWGDLGYDVFAVITARYLVRMQAHPHAGGAAAQRRHRRVARGHRSRAAGAGGPPRIGEGGGGGRGGGEPKKRSPPLSWHGTNAPPLSWLKNTPPDCFAQEEEEQGDHGVQGEGSSAAPTPPPMWAPLLARSVAWIVDKLEEIRRDAANCQLELLSAHLQRDGAGLEFGEQS
jgi:hypothetical protein